MNTKNYKFRKASTELQNTKHRSMQIFSIFFSLQLLKLQLIIEITFTMPPKIKVYIYISRQEIWHSPSRKTLG